MCDCLQKMNDKIKDKLHPNAEHISVNNLEYMSGKLFSTFEVSLPDKKKPIKVNVLYSNCPFCGEPYGKTE